MMRIHDGLWNSAITIAVIDWEEADRNNVSENDDDHADQRTTSFTIRLPY